MLVLVLSPAIKLRNVFYYSKDKSDLPMKLNGLVKNYTACIRVIQTDFFLQPDDVKNMLAKAGEQKQTAREDSYGRVVTSTV